MITNVSFDLTAPTPAKVQVYLNGTEFGGAIGTLKTVTVTDEDVTIKVSVDSEKQTFSCEAQVCTTVSSHTTDKLNWGTECSFQIGPFHKLKVTCEKTTLDEAPRKCNIRLAPEQG